MSNERFLITGALGCIGAWSCAQLVREDVPVILYDLGTNRGRLELVMSPEQIEQLTLVQRDVTDLEQVERTIGDYGITHIVHLAAMLLPLVQADPPRGAAVNVVGTTNILEAAKRQDVAGIAYASSAAVYGPGAGPRIADAGEPTTLYGVFKLANEGTAHVYFEDEGVGSVGLRPYVVYGPGRDQGLTADPTLAMEAAARGEGYKLGRSLPAPVRRRRRSDLHRRRSGRAPRRGGLQPGWPVVTRE
jgi:UDP-glucuronate 4-epimerase